MNEILTGVSGNQVFDEALESLPPSVQKDILIPITFEGPTHLAVIHGWVDQFDLFDPRG